MNIVIVEDAELVRAQLTRLIAREPRLSVVGTAADEAEAVDVILRTGADAVLLDLSLAPGSGLRVLRRIRQQGCGARVLILTNNSDPALRQACDALGVQGYFDKTHEFEACLAQLVAWLPPLPANETRRLELLLDTALLDTPEQEVFDNLTCMAAEIAQTPIALISLVGADRQWFLSRTGTDLRETSRSVSFCAHAILHDDLMEVPDARSDPRFTDNPLVTGAANIRFYAGLPLVFPSGEALGTLCVIDSEPRALTDAQRHALKTLASSAVTQIELRRRVRHLEEESERRRIAEARIHHLATRDPLTGLPNRTTFRDRLEHHIQIALRQNTALGVMFIDLDGFKPINDTLGHDIGDEVLVRVAERLKATVRSSDTPARLGGDEFAIVLPELSTEAEVMQVAAKLIAALSEPIAAKGHTVQLSASIGGALFPDHGRLGDELLRNADLAMYHAKQNGRRRACIYSRALSDLAAERLSLECDLREALRRDELVLHYQPQIALHDGELRGVEALVRWPHPKYGLLAPERFVPLAERTGLIGSLTQRALDIALAQLHDWDRRGLDVPRTAINVPASEISAEFAAALEASLERHRIAPHRLELEITESTLANEGGDTMRVLGNLRSRGISIAVDDFGIGSSSLAQLQRLPIDSLKIDRSFIRSIETSPGDQAIVCAVIGMGNALGLQVVAEGVERAAQLEAVRQAGCHVGQGYYIGEPLAGADFETWLRRTGAIERCA